MKYNLLLNSQLAKLQRNGANQHPHDFEINFDPPIELDPVKNYEEALDELITMSYSLYNIAEVYGNNKLKWRMKTGNWQTLTFPDGMYDYKDINNVIQGHLGVVDPDAEQKKQIFDIYFNFNNLPGRDFACRKLRPRFV